MSAIVGVWVVDNGAPQADGLSSLLDEAAPASSPKASIPSAEEALREIELYLSRRKGEVAKARDANKAAFWFVSYGENALIDVYEVHPSLASACTGWDEANDYLCGAIRNNSKLLIAEALAAANADVACGIGGAAQAIEARRDETRSGSAEGESVVGNADAHELYRPVSRD